MIPFHFHSTVKSVYHTSLHNETVPWIFENGNRSTLVSFTGLNADCKLLCCYSMQTTIKSVIGGKSEPIWHKYLALINISLHKYHNTWAPKTAGFEAK